jgi:hypothetical protein
MIEYMLKFLINVLLCILTFSLGWWMHIQNNNITPVAS